MNTKEKNLLKIMLISIAVYFMLLRFDILIGVTKNALSLCKVFIWGGVMAFIINVPMRKVELFLKKLKLKKGVRFLSFLITVLLIVIFTVSFLFIVVPQLVSTIYVLADHIQNLYYSIPEITGSSSSSIAITIEKYLSALNIDLEAVIFDFIDTLKNMSITILGKSSAFITGIIGKFTTFMLSCVFAVYLILGKEKNCAALKILIKSILPDRISNKIFHVAEITSRIFTSFISGQCFEALILGSMFTVAMSIFGMPYALLVGVTISVTALIPIFGAFIGCAVGVFLIAIENPIQAIWFVIMFVILQQIEGNLIYPQVVGNSIGLPSILVFMSVIVGGNLMGITGMLLFIPAMSVIYTLIKEFVVNRNKKAEKEIAESEV